MASVSGDQLWLVDDDKEIARWLLWAVRLLTLAILFVLVGGSLSILFSGYGQPVRELTYIGAGLLLAYVVYDVGTTLAARQ